MSSKPVRSITCLAFVAVGCATTPADPMGDPMSDPMPDPTARVLTCEIIAGPNCWQDALAAVAACAPGDTIAGTLASDGKSCSYPSGDSVSFDTNATLIGIDTSFSFELTTAGSLCAGFSSERSPNVRTLRTALGTASWTNDDMVTLSCPDGTVYQTDTLSALRCDGFPDALGFTWASGATVFDFSFLAKPQNVDVMQCGM